MCSTYSDRLHWFGVSFGSCWPPTNQLITRSSNVGKCSTSWRIQITVRSMPESKLVLFEVMFFANCSNISTSVSHSVFDAANTLYHVRKLPRTPWRHFLKSAAVYAICLAHFGNNWGVYAYLTELPSYMHNVLKYSLTANGFLSALPYCALWLVQISAGFLADKLRTKGYASNTTIRKVLNAVALFVPAIFLALVPLAGCNHMLAVGAFIVALGFMGFSQGGYMVRIFSIAK